MFQRIILILVLAVIVFFAASALVTSMQLEPIANRLIEAEIQRHNDPFDQATRMYAMADQRRG